MNNSSTLIRSFFSISPEIGIIKDICKLPRLNNDPYVNCYGANASSGKSSYKEYSIKAGGCHLRWENAILSTIGESLERYAAGFYDINESVTGTYNGLISLQKEKLISPNQFSLFHKKQYEFGLKGLTEFNENTNLTWFPSLDLIKKEKVWLPGQFIYLPFIRDEDKVTLNISTGLAAHTNYYKAILNGIYEVIERDSFVLTWWQKISPPHIIISSKILTYIKNLFPNNYEWYFFDITYDIQVPTVLCLCYIQTECGKFPVISSATRYTYHDAIVKSIHEIAQSIPFYRLLLEKNQYKFSQDFSQLKSFDDHAWQYMINESLWHVFDNWINSRKRIDVDLNESINIDDKNIIRSILSIFREKSYNVLLKDITTPDLRQIGYYAIKIFIPQLLPLSGAYDYYFLGGSRLYSVPIKMGYKAYAFDQLNKYPHPFP